MNRKEAIEFIKDHRWMSSEGRQVILLSNVIGLLNNQFDLNIPQTHSAGYIEEWDYDE